MASADSNTCNTIDKTNNNASIQDENTVKCSYDAKLREFYANHSQNERNVKKPWSSDRILKVIQQIKSSRVTTQRSSMDYYWLAKYDVMEIAGEEILIFKKSSINDPTISIVPIEKYYEILKEVHKIVGHGGRLKMMQNLKNKLYIPKKAIDMFVDQCSVCEMKRRVPKKGIVTQPIISKDFNVRGQVDLIDLQSAPDGEYKWIMNYQDHATKFVHLRPLKTKKATEVAMQLLKIFLEFGAPFILQSDNGREFTANIIEELVKMWPECKIVDGSPRRPQTQGSVERSNQDVENMLRCWMQDNKCTKWSIGCYFVQYFKNSSYHRIIGRSPYRAMFGSDPKTVLRGCNVTEALISSICTEEELDKITQEESSITEHYEASLVQVCDNYLTSEANNEMPTNNLAGNVVTNGIELAQPIINETRVDYTITAYDKDVQIIDHSEDNIVVMEMNNELVSSNDERCTVCGQGTSGAHTCSACCKPVHAICGISLGEEGYGAHVLCNFCQNEQLIVNQREEAHRGVKRAAEKMVDATAKKLPSLEIGNSVFLNVPKIDRGPLDTKNILGKIVDLKNGVYKVGTSAGTIKNWFSRQDLQVSAQDYSDVILETPISLRQAVSSQSLFGGQGFQRCSCKPSKNQCHTNRCACFKNKLLCTSKCHQSLSCINK